MEKNYGKITVGFGTDLEQELKIIDFVQSVYPGNRIITVSQIEDKSYFLSVENPPSSGRNTQSNFWLSKESVIALVSSIMLYFKVKNEDLDTLIKKLDNGQGFNYSFSDNLEEIKS